MKTPSEKHAEPTWFGEHAVMRPDIYALLAALLTDTPTKERLELVCSLSWHENIAPEVGQALAELTAAGGTSPADVASEYNRLFVGLGSGDLVPYASWYLEKTIQSIPLSRIRCDLARLGILRKAECFDSEDHAGALCEIMALISSGKNRVTLAEQAAFFHRHMSTWMISFFQDMQGVTNGRFYPAVGKFAQCFFEVETNYLKDSTERISETGIALENPS